MCAEGRIAIRGEAPLYQSRAPFAAVGLSALLAANAEAEGLAATRSNQPGIQPHSPNQSPLMMPWFAPSQNSIITYSMQSQTVNLSPHTKVGLPASCMH